MEKEGGIGGGRETGIDMVMDTQIPLGAEVFFTNGETEAKSQRSDQDQTASPGGWGSGRSDC